MVAADSAVSYDFDGSYIVWLQYVEFSWTLSICGSASPACCAFSTFVTNLVHCIFEYSNIYMCVCGITVRILYILEIFVFCSWSDPAR
jgi:hypothetical protein